MPAQLNSSTGSSSKGGGGSGAVGHGDVVAPSKNHGCPGGFEFDFGRVADGKIQGRFFGFERTYRSRLSAARIPFGPESQRLRARRESFAAKKLCWPADLTSGDDGVG